MIGAFSSGRSEVSVKEFSCCFSSLHGSVTSEKLARFIGMQRPKYKLWIPALKCRRTGLHCKLSQHAHLSTPRGMTVRRSLRGHLGAPRPLRASGGRGDRPPAGFYL